MHLTYLAMEELQYQGVVSSFYEERVLDLIPVAGSVIHHLDALTSASEQ
jgi:hypothetical protein